MSVRVLEVGATSEVCALLAKVLRPTLLRLQPENGASLPASLWDYVNDVEAVERHLRARQATATVGVALATVTALRLGTLDSDDELTVSEAAELLGCSPQAIRQRIARHTLPARRHGHVWKIRRENVT